MNWIAKLLLLSVIVSTLSLLSGCQNTAEGMNQDIKQNTHDIRQEINS